MRSQNVLGFDLNLLLVFQTLMTEQSVSRAAQKLGLAQPTVSSALRRLRLLLHDDLFMRTPQGIRPTPRALELATPIAEALEQLRTGLHPRELFDAATTQRHFAIGASDNVDYALAPGFAAFCRDAPLATFNLVEAIGESAISMLDVGSIDVAVGLFDSLPKRFDSTPLYFENYICVARRDHPELGGGLTLQKFVALPHLLVFRDTAKTVDAALAARGLVRRIAARVPTFALAPHLLSGTDLLTVVGERIGHDFVAHADFQCHPVPLDLPPWQISAIWRRRVNPDEGILWLLEKFKDAANLISR